MYGLAHSGHRASDADIVEASPAMLLLLTGPSGSGKTSLAALTVSRYGWELINVFSTRPPRRTQAQDTKDLVRQSEMTQIASGPDVLVAKYDGHQYATPLIACRRAAASPLPIAVVDWVHPHSIDIRTLGKYVHAVVLLPSIEVVKDRLAQDGRSSRVDRAVAELRAIEARRDSYHGAWSVIDANQNLDEIAEYVLHVAQQSVP